MGPWRSVTASVLLLTLCFATPAARAEGGYPSHPIRLIMGYPAGTMADISTRVLTNHMGQSLGQQIVIENKPGAGSNLAAETAARAPNDGYTLYLCASANVANQAINPKLPFDMEKDFTPIALLSAAAVVLVINPSLGVNSVQELVALAKSKPGELNYASVGIGSALHLSAELLVERTGIKLQHVPYQGSPQAVNDLVAGRTQMMFAPAATVVPLIQSGKLKVLASATAKRTGILPDVPTMAEMGLSDFDTSIWSGLMAPAGTPREVVDRLARAAAEATKSPEVINAWRPLGVDPLSGGPEQFAHYIKSELKRWGVVAVAAGLRK